MSNVSRLTFHVSRLSSFLIEKGILLLLVFTPLAFGTVEVWSNSVMEILAFSVLCLHLIGKTGAGEAGIPRQLRSVFLLFCGFLLLVLLQLLPLPEGVLALVSPETLRTYKEFGTDTASALHPISLNPHATASELLKLLAYASVFYVIINHYRTKEQVRSLAMTIIYMAGFLVAFAIIQKVLWNGRVFWLYPVEWADAGRVWGSYLNRNHFAGYMEMAIPLGLAMLAYAAPNVASLPGAPFAKRTARFLASSNLVPFTFVFLIVLVMSAALLMTLSRGGIAAFCLSSLFFVWITYKRRSLKRRTGLIALAAGALSVLLLVAAWDKVAERFGDIQDEQDVHRLKVWQESLPVIKDFSLIGSGLGTYEDIYMRHQKTKPLMSFDHAHNDYLELLTDTGAIGLLLGCGTAALFFITAFRAWRRKHSMFGKCLGAGGLASCVAISAHSVTDFNLHISANALLLSVIAALTYAAIFNVSERNGSAESAEEGGRRKEGGERRKDLFLPLTPHTSRLTVFMTSYVLRLTFFLVFLFLLYFPIRDLLADHYYRRVAGILDDKSTEGLDEKPISAQSMPDYRAALDSLETARGLAPSDPLYPRILSDLYGRLGRWAETMAALKAGLPAAALPKEEALQKAVERLQEAVRLRPTDPDYHLALGQMYDTVLGDVRRADIEFRKAAEAYPVSAPIRQALALYYLSRGRSGDALEQARILAGLDDSYLLPDSPQKTQIIEGRSDSYRSLLYKSYLFSALEIAWRASDDAAVVRGIAPTNPEAQEVVKLFIESRGIE